MDPFIEASLMNLAGILEGNGQQLQQALPGVGMTFLNTASVIRNIANQINTHETMQLLAGKGPAAESIRYHYRFLDATQPLGEGVQRNLPDFAFQPLFTRKDQASAEGKASQNPFDGSGQWLFPLLMHLSLGNELALPPGVTYDAEKRLLTAVHENVTGGWFTKVHLHLPAQAMSSLHAHVETHNTFEDVTVSIQNTVLGYDWLQQNVIAPLYELNDLDPTWVVPVKWTIADVRPAMREFGEALNFAELYTRMPYHLRYRFENLDLYRTISIKTPWPKDDQAIFDVSVNINLELAYFTNDAEASAFNPEVRFHNEATQIGLFHCTPYRNNSCYLKDLPYDFQRQVMDQLPHRFEQELTAQLEVLKTEHPEIFVPRQAAE